jgi:hypothetical protein
MKSLFTIHHASHHAPQREAITAQRIYRGFRRLAVLSVFIGLVFIAFDWITKPPPTPRDLERVLLFFIVAPAAFTLLLGWVIAGFFP